MLTNNTPTWDESEEIKTPTWEESSEFTPPTWEESQPHVPPIGKLPPSRFGANIQPPVDFVGGAAIEAPFAPTERFARNPLQATPPENPESLQPLVKANEAKDYFTPPPQPKIGEQEIASVPLPIGSQPWTPEQAARSNQNAWEQVQKVPADAARAAVADIGFALSRNFQNIFKADPGGGNLQAWFKGESLPIDEAISLAAQDSADRGEFTTAAAAARISQDLTATAPLLLGFAGLPAVGARVVGAAFTYKMLTEAPETFRKLGAEMGKPKEQQDPNLIAQLVSQGAQEIGFGGLGLLHGVSTLPKLPAELGGIRDAGNAIKEKLVPGSTTVPRQEAYGYNRAPFKPQRPEAGADVRAALKPTYVMTEQPSTAQGAGKPPTRVEQAAPVTLNKETSDRFNDIQKRRAAGEVIPPEDIAFESEYNALNKKTQDVGGMTPEMLAEIAANKKARTAPKPDWKVRVQAVQGEVPGFIQIIDPRAKENTQSPTIESLKALGHEVPDFSKLPQGNYTWEEAVAKLKEMEKPTTTKKPTHIVTEIRKIKTAGGADAWQVWERPIGSRKRLTFKLFNNEAEANAYAKSQTPAAQPKVEPVKQEKKRTDSQIFDDLIQEVAGEAEWLKGDPLLALYMGNRGIRSRAPVGQDVAANKAQSQAFIAARRQAALALGIDPFEVTDVKGRAKHLKALQAWVEEHRKRRAVAEDETKKADTNDDANRDSYTPEQDSEGNDLFSKASDPLQPESGAPVQLTPKSQRQIIADLAKGLDVPIRFGRLTTRKFAGYFKKVANLIGANKANQVPLVSHEVGHKLDSTFKLSGDPAIRSELNVLGDPSTPGSYSSWTPSKSRAYKLGEGVAEFTRLWLTDPARAKNMAPRTWAAFEAALNANKDFGDTMRTAQEDIRVWRTSQPQARLRSHISVGDNPNKTPYTVSQLTRDLVDDLHFGRLAMDDAQRFSNRTFDPTENFYMGARLLRGSYGMADTFIRQGTTDFKTKAVTLGTSLEDALKPVSGRINDFRDWIVAKQAKELHSKGKETGLVPSDVDAVVAQFDSDPAFQEAFAKIKAWNDSLLQYSVDAGLVTPDAAAAMRKMNQDYVPFHRIFEVGAGEPSAVEGGGTGRGLNVGKPGSLRGRHGSPRDIVDPLETMVRNAYALITASEKAAINLAVADLSKRPGMGKWVEEIATPQQNVRVGLEKLRKQLEDAGADLSQVPDDLLLNFFQNSGRVPFGENTIKVIRNGKPEFYRLNKDLFDTFHALDLDDSGKLIRILSSPTQLLRSGVTVAPDFALANAIRDTFSAAILSKYNAFPFEVTLRGFGAMLNNPKLVAEWAASGGKNSIEANYFDREKLQNFLKERITKDLTPAEQALIVAKSPLAALRWLTAISEEATRIGEYQKAFNALTKQGMPEGEARRLAAFESRDRQDFARGGAKTKIVRHLAAFWNAQLQANVKLAQTFKNRPLQTIGKGLLYITTAKMLEQAVNWDDEDYWDRPQWERDLFFLIPIGKGDDGHTRFLRIPTPFELGVIFGTLPGRLLQWAKEKNPESMKDFSKLALQQTVPNPTPQALQTVMEVSAGKKGWSFYRGRPIVPDRLASQPPEMQFTEQTSLTAKKLGKLLGVSPLKVDHIIASTSGGVGQVLTHQVSDRAISAITGEERTAKGKVPGGRFITTPAAVQSKASDDFYNTLEEIRTANEGLKRGKPTNLDVTLLPKFEEIREKIAGLNRRIEVTKDDAERTRLLNQRLSAQRETMAAYRKLQRKAP